MPDVPNYVPSSDVQTRGTISEILAEDDERQMCMAVAFPNTVLGFS